VGISIWILLNRQERMKLVGRIVTCVSLPGRQSTNFPFRSIVRYSTYSPTLTELLYPVIIPNIPSAIPTPKSLFPRIKLYHYPPGTFFESHYDDSVKDPQTGLKSEWTVLIFLSGEEDGIEGGGTVFHLPRVGKKKEGEVLRVRAKRGRMVLHKHGRDCLLHEGELVRSGKIGKWVLRTDLMY
jgi:hypothetical protein